MRSFVAIALSLLIGLTSSSHFFVWVVFEVAQPYVEQRWCVNKDRPEMQCHGKCFLHQELQRQEQQDTGKEPLNIDEALKLTLIASSLAALTAELILPFNMRPVGATLGAGADFVAELFHPPRPVLAFFFRIHV